MGKIEAGVFGVHEQRMSRYVAEDGTHAIIQKNGGWKTDVVR